jgi:hypothetical protein
MWRHESLRTRIVIDNDIPRQHVNSPQEYRLDVIDLTGRSPIDTEPEVKQLAQEFLDQKIDLSADPLFDSKLWKLSDHEYVFILALDHIVSDGISYEILDREIWELYRQSMKGLPFTLPHLPAQFPDYAVWQQRTHRAWKNKHEQYWRLHLAGVEYVRLPSDVEPDEASPPVVVSQHISFGNSLSAKLREVARREVTPVHLLVLAMYIIVMSRWCDREELVITYISHGRQGRPELENMIGLVVNWVYLRIRLVKEETFRELLTRVRLEVSTAFEHLDFNRVPNLVPECRNELEFHWQSSNRAVRANTLPEKAEQRIRMQPVSLRAPNWFPRFWPVFYDTASGISVTIHYRPDTFVSSSIEIFGYNLRLIANEYVQCPIANLTSTWMKMRRRVRHNGNVGSI